MGNDDIGLFSSSAKTVWQYWHQGYDRLPSIAKLCQRSWRENNSDWQVRLVDSTNLATFLPKGGLLERSKYPSLQKFSNHVRLLLLIEYGGIWADVDVFCNSPIRDWLKNSDQGLPLTFFRDPGKGRLVANWFIAAEPNNRVLIALEKMYSEYFLLNEFRSDRISRAVTSRIAKTIDAISFTINSPRLPYLFWNSSLVRKVFHLTPYFIFHYMFVEAWQESGENPFELPGFWPSAQDALALRRAARKAARNQIKLRLMPHDVPLYKMSYRTMDPATVQNVLDGISGSQP